MFLHLNIGPSTLRLPLVLHPIQGTSLHFAIRPCVDQTMACLLHPVLLDLSPQPEDNASGEAIQWTNFLSVCTLQVPIHLELLLGMWTYQEPEWSLSYSLPSWQDQCLCSGPGNVLSLKWSSGHYAISSWNIIHSNNSNSQNWLVLAVSWGIIVSAISSSSCYIPCVVLDLMKDSSSRQSSQSLFEVPDIISFLPEPFFYYFISFSAVFNHGVHDLVCLEWHNASLSFLLNSPRIISLASSHITAGDTQSFPHPVCIFHIWY